MKDLKRTASSTSFPHPVSFVSLGPGEPELITLKGLKALQEADLIFCPSTQRHDGSSVSRASKIMQALNIPTERLIYFHLPMSKERTQALKAYEAVYNEIVSANPALRKICVAVEGDAGLYASIHYIYEKLQSNHIPVRQIAGIPAFIAAGAHAGLHMVSQEERLYVIPGVTTVDEIEEHTRKGETVVIMKLSQCINEVHLFIHSHMDLDYHYFENVGTDNEKYLHEAQEIAALNFPYFSLLIIRSKRDT